MPKEIQKNTYSNHYSSVSTSGLVINTSVYIEVNCIIASIIYRTSDCQEELSANNRKHTEDYVLEEFNKSTEVLSLPLPNPDGTFNGKSSFVDKIMA
jgi:hypothetical protein